MGTIAYATRIDISSEWLKRADGSEQTQEGKRTILILAATRMSENNTADTSFRLVITTDGTVYLSSESGETWASWAASWVKKDSATDHNIQTHEVLLDIFYNRTQTYSRDVKLRTMHEDQRTNIPQLKQKDIKINILAKFLSNEFHVSLPFFLIE